MVWLWYAPWYAHMKTIKYKIKGIRMDEKTWELLKEERLKSGLSWNLFLLSLISLVEKIKKPIQIKVK